MQKPSDQKLEPGKAWEWDYGSEAMETYMEVSIVTIILPNELQMEYGGSFFYTSASEFEDMLVQFSH